MRAITAIVVLLLGACGGKKMTARESCEAFVMRAQDCQRAGDPPTYDLGACADDPDEHASTWAPLGACAEERTCDEFRACVLRTP